MTKITSGESTQKLAHLSQQRLELAARLLRRKNGEPSQAQQTQAQPIPRLPRTPEQSTFPLSFTQQRLWILDQLDPGLAAYHIPVAVQFTGRLDIRALTQSLNEVGRRHEVLRTTFGLAEAERPVQVIHPASPQPLPLIDLTDLQEPARESELARLVKADLHRPFDLTHGPLLRLNLFRLNRAEHLLLLTIHHIVCDGWSLGVITREITALYEAFSLNQESPLPELPIQYVDYAAWQQQGLQADGEIHLAYWKKHLAGTATVLELPSDRPRPAAQSFRGAAQTLGVPSRVTEALKALSQQAGVTLFMTLLAAFQTLLYRHSGQTDIIVGSPIANRTHAETERLIGYFANMLALRARLDAVSGNPTFLELLGRVREVCLDAYTHQALPFEHLVEALDLERDLSRNPLFQVLFGLHNAPVPQLELPGLTISRPTLKAETSRFDLALDMWESGHELVGSLEYSTDLFDDATMTRMIGHFQTLLAGIVANPEQQLSQLPLLTDPEEQQLLVEWNATQRAYPEDHCLHHLFEAQVERTPETVAVIFEDQSLTYRALNERAEQLAHYLRGLGVGPEARVGLRLERSLEMVIALLGILKAGGVYVPLDPTYPDERLAFMLEDSQTTVLITQSYLLKTPKPQNSNPKTSITICLDTDWPSISQSAIPLRSASGTIVSNPQSPISSISTDNLAYILYTSGSTGQPKGVQISHRALVNFLCAVQREPGLTPADVLLSVTTMAFDIFGLELYLPLLTGARVELASRETALDGVALQKHLRTSGATVMQATPATWRLLLEAGWTEAGGLKILYGGEALPRPLADDLLATGGEVWNLYGPTETTIWSSVQRIAAGTGPIVIGRPLANTQFYILDAEGQPVPVGVVGELHIGGEGVARGYLGRPELTAERFIPNPFAGPADGGRKTDDGGETTSTVHRPPSTVLRLYKTGDLARYLPNGNIECLGRRDQQVKVRGYRIELGEIESVLGQHPAVRACAVVTRETGFAESKQLAAYVVLAGEEDGRRMTEDGSSSSVLRPSSSVELRAFLKACLPDYMTPAAFVFLDALPLTPNGKVDRCALSTLSRARVERSKGEGLAPASRGTRSEFEVAYVAPRNATEATLAQIWAALLNLERVGIHDNFFTLGGDSLLVVRVIAQAGRAGLRFSTKLFFQYQTIAGLAEALRTAPEIKAEQGLVVGPVPLTPILRWYFDLEVDNPHVNNIALLYETSPDLDPAPLTPAVRQVLLHHDVLRTRFERGASGWQARIVEPGVEMDAVVWIDLSTVQPEDSSAVIQVACAELQTSLHITRGPLLRLAQFNLGPAQPGRVLLVFHHLVVDVLSLQLFLADLRLAYEQLRRGETVQLPPKTTSAKEWAERLVEYARSETLQSEIDYWLSLPWDQVAPLPVDVPAERANQLQGQVETTAVRLSVEETEAMLQQVRAADDLHVADFLLAALRMAFAPWTGDRPLLVDLIGHGREPLFDDLDLARTVLWSIALVPLFLEAADDPRQALQAARAARRRLPQGGIGFGVLRYLGEGPGVEKLKALPGAEIQFSYLGQTGARAAPGAARSPAPIRPAREPMEGSVDPRNQRPELFYCHSQIRQGQLYMRFAYGNSLYRRETVEKLADDFLEALRTLILAQDHPANYVASLSPVDEVLADG